MSAASLFFSLPTYFPIPGNSPKFKIVSSQGVTRYVQVVQKPNRKEVVVTDFKGKTVDEYGVSDMPFAAVDYKRWVYEETLPQSGSGGSGGSTKGPGYQRPSDDTSDTGSGGEITETEEAGMTMVVLAGLTVLVLAFAGYWYFNR